MRKKTGRELLLLELLFWKGGNLISDPRFLDVKQVYLLHVRVNFSGKLSVFFWEWNGME